MIALLASVLLLSLTVWLTEGLSVEGREKLTDFQRIELRRARTPGDFDLLPR